MAHIGHSPSIYIYTETLDIYIYRDLLIIFSPLGPKIWAQKQKGGKYSTYFLKNVFLTDVEPELYRFITLLVRIRFRPFQI